MEGDLSAPYQPQAISQHFNTFLMLAVGPLQVDRYSLTRHLTAHPGVEWNISDLNKDSLRV